MKENLEPMAQFFNDRAAIYDEVHLGHTDGGMAGKEIVAQHLPEHTQDILNLGCGTGLELPAVFARFPQACVIGIDLAQDMLGLLHKRCAGFDVTTLCMSYFEYDFLPESFDAVISVMSLHHFTPKQKRGLYSRVRGALRPGGVFLNCDYIIDSSLEECKYFVRQALKRQRPGDTHFDTPLTIRHELNVLHQAGFSSAQVLWREGNTQLVCAAV